MSWRWAAVLPPPQICLILAEAAITHAHAGPANGRLGNIGMCWTRSATVIEPAVHGALLLNRQEKGHLLALRSPAASLDRTRHLRPVIRAASSRLTAPHQPPDDRRPWTHYLPKPPPPATRGRAPHRRP